MALISDALMTRLAKIDESAMKSRMTVFFAGRSDNPRGGSTAGSEKRKNTTPVKCRVAYAQTERQETPIGGRMQSIADVQIAYPLGIVVTNDDAQIGPLVIDSDDEIAVTSDLKRSDGSTYSVTERYKVVGDPGPGSYVTSQSVAAVKIS
jgi:hypothetical protein